MELFNSCRKLFKAEIITVKPEVSLLLNASLHIHSLTFITEALCVVAAARWFTCLLLWCQLCLLCKACTTHCVTKAMPIHRIDGQRHTIKLKISKTGLTNYRVYIAPYHDTGCLWGTHIALLITTLK